MDLASNITLQQLALGAGAGKLGMYEDCSTNSGANRMVPGNESLKTKTTEVPVSTLDLFVSDKKITKINFIKIDIEGFEMEALKGCYDTLVTMKPDLFIEVDNSNLKKQGSSSIELFEYLRKLGYNMYEEGKAVALDFNVPDKPVNIYCTVKLSGQ